MQALARGNRLIDENGAFRQKPGDYSRNGRGTERLADRKLRMSKLGPSGRLSRRTDRVGDGLQRGDPILVLVREIKDLATFWDGPAWLVGRCKERNRRCGSYEDE